MREVYVEVVVTNRKDSDKKNSVDRDTSCLKINVGLTNSK